MAVQKAGRVQLAMGIAADRGSIFLQPGNAGPNLTVEILEEMIADDVEHQADLHCIDKKHVPEMQRVARDFFVRHFKPLYALYFKAPPHKTLLVASLPTPRGSTP